MAEQRKSNRREFLQGKSAAQTLADLGQQALDGQADAGYAPSVARPTGYLVQFSRQAMACQFEIFLNAGQYAGGTEAAVQALDLVEQLEGQMTVFRDHSEISELNRTAHLEAVELEPRLFALLEQAVRIYRETNGAYDVTAGPLSRVWGFTRRRGAIPDDAQLAEARAHVGSDQLELDASAASVRFRTPGIEINLGSIGKGYALDRCAELLRAAGVHDFLLHGGQSSVLAGGSETGAGEVSAAEAPPRMSNEEPRTASSPDLGSPGWLVGVRDPLRPRWRLGQIDLRNRALATSGSGVQFFVHGKERYGHILDPRTGWPARGVLSTTVVAPSAAEADALSTAFYVMGPDATEEYCRRHRQVGCIMSCPGEREGALDLSVFGLGEADWIPTPAVG